MALNAMSMGYAFTAKDMASGTMARLNMRIQELSQSSKELEKRYKKATGGIKKGGATAAVGIGGLVAIHKASKAYGDFEFTIVSAAGKMADGAANMEALKKSAIDAGIATQFSPAEAAAGLSELGAQGLSAKQAMTALLPVLDLAAGSLGQLGVAEASTVAMASLNAFGKTVDELPDVVDKLTMVSDRSAFQMRDFQTAISQAAAQAKAGDQSFESMLSTLGLLRDAGNEASSAATAYREAVRRVAGDKLALEEMKKLGVTSVDAGGQLKDISRIVAELHPKLAALGVQQRNLALKTIFGVRGMKTYNAVMASYEKRLKNGEALVGDYASGHTFLMGELEKSSGVTKKKVNQALDTVGGKYKLLSGSIQTLVIKIGETFAVYVKPALDWLIGSINDVIKFINNMSDGQKKAIGAAMAFGAALLTIVGVLRILKGLYTLFSLSKLAGAFVAGQTAMGKSTNDTTKELRLQDKYIGKTKGAYGALQRTMSGVGWIGAAMGIAGVAVAAYGLGEMIGGWLIQKFKKSEIEAMKAAETWTKFTVSFNTMGRALAKQTSAFGKFNTQLRAHVRVLEEAAAVSGAAADRVLAKTTTTLGKLGLEQQSIQVKMWKAVRAGNEEEALKMQKQLHETNQKIRAMHEARLHIQAGQYAGVVGQEQNADKRRYMQQTILMSAMVKQQYLEAEAFKWKQAQLAALDSITNKTDKERTSAQIAAAWETKRAAVEESRLAIVKKARAIGMIKGKFVSGADYDRLFSQIAPQMKGRGIIQSQRFASTHTMGRAATGTAVGIKKDLSDEAIDFYGTLRKSNLMSFGASKEQANREAEFYKWSLRQRREGGATPWLDTKAGEGGEAGKLRAMMYQVWKDTVYNKEGMRTSADVTLTINSKDVVVEAAKTEARNGGRLKVLGTAAK